MPAAIARPEAPDGVPLLLLCGLEGLQLLPKGALRATTTVGDLLVDLGDLVQQLLVLTGAPLRGYAVCLVVDGVERLALAAPCGR